MTTLIKNIETQDLREKLINKHSVNTYKAAPTNEVLGMECEIYNVEGEFSFVFVPANKYSEECFGVIDNKDFVYGNDAIEVKEEAIEIINE